jgi:putative tryptophan/tyrosine transport system permease protein
LEALITLLIFVDAVTYNVIGLLFAATGVAVLVRHAGYPDLTVDGSFTFSSALFAGAAVSGIAIPLAFLIACAGSIGAGALTWVINAKLGIGRVVASALAMTILLLSAPYISGGSSKSLVGIASVFSGVEQIDLEVSRTLIGDRPYRLHLAFSGILFVLLAGVLICLNRFLQSKAGIAMRYVGSAVSARLVPIQRRPLLLLMGLVVGNVLLAIGACIETYRRGGFTNNMGLGTLVVLLVAMVLGEAILKAGRKRDYLHLSEHFQALFWGCIIYVVGLQLILLLRIDFLDLRLMSAFLLVILLGIAGRIHSSSARLF